MRFSLSHLLLLFPAYLGGVVLASIWQPGAGAPVDRRYQVALRQVIAAHEAIDSAGPEVFADLRADELGPASEGRVEKWLAHRLRLDDPAMEQLGDYPGRDPWGNFYVLAKDIESANGPRSFGVYSLGEDGNSGSEGNDADDLNSWDPQCHLHYSFQDPAAERGKALLYGLLFAPAVFVVLLGGVLLVQVFRPGYTPARRPVDMVDELYEVKP